MIAAPAGAAALRVSSGGDRRPYLRRHGRRQLARPDAVRHSQQHHEDCTFTFNSEIHATIDGDVLTGEIDYLSATNGNPDCAAVASCRSLQNFNGTRPPR
jgi:hypothetical protein